jgi:streptogramin lyase
MRMTSTAQLRQTLQLTAGLALTSALLLLSGCAFSGSPVTTAANGGGGTTAAHFKGSVFGGQQPVNGATIQLYTVGTAGNGSTATPLLTATVKSSASGTFDITGKYACTSATQVYIVATGGDAGSGNNTALSLMAALGPCAPLISNPTFININELTTVAAVYALAPFMNDYQSVGATGSNPTGLVNAFATAQFLVSTASGALATAPTGVTLPTARLNSLADILAACVNTSGPTSPACTTLFNVTSATETIGAGLAIAQDPTSSSVTALYSLPTGTPPFVPGLSAQPNDYTLAVNYTGAELSGPFGVAVDISGNAWVTNEAGTSVVKLPALSSTFATSAYANGGLLAPRGISIDRSGHVWIANTGGNDVVELDGTSGAALSGSGFGVGSLSGPVAIANDSAGNAWVANFLGNSLSELGTNGAPSGASPITAPGSLSEPTSIAIGPTGRVAVASSGTGSVCLFSNAGALQSCPTDGTLFGATAVAVSSTGNIALAGTTTGPTVSGAFTLATTAGAVSPSSPATGGGLTLPTAVAYDSAGNAWFTNSASLSAFSVASPETGNTGIGSLNSPSGLAIDASGNIWTANTGDNSVSVFVGLAAPVVTPLAANVGP